MLQRDLLTRVRAGLALTPLGIRRYGASAADRIFEPTILAPAKSVGEPRDGRLTDVLRHAHTEAGRLLLEGRPYVRGEADSCLVHWHSEFGNDILGVVSDIASAIPEREGHDGAHGEVLAEVSRSVVRLHKDVYGKGPTRARSHMVGDLLVCVLAGGFTRAELTLLAGGKGDVVRHQREELQAIARDRFTTTIESITGRPVLGWLSSIDEHAQLSAEVFVLEPREVDGASGDGRVDQSRDGELELRIRSGSIAQSRDGRPPT
jgi:uncharacterized protein YbcI